MEKPAFARYYRDYHWKDIFAMLRNNRRDPALCREPARGKLVLITGATSGIGYHTARRYAEAGADLLCVNRNRERSEALAREIETEFGVRCSYMLADLSLRREVSRVADRLLQLERLPDILIHNAGIYLTRRELTEEGLEKTFAVHCLAPFIFTRLLAEGLKAQGPARIILVSSEGHRFAAWGLRCDDLNWEKRRYSGLKGYGSAKLAQLLMLRVFARLFGDSQVSISAMHPGAVKTDTGQENGAFYRWIKRNFLDRQLRPPSIAAEALFYLGVSGEAAVQNGKFFNLTTEEKPAPPALDEDLAEELWNTCTELCATGRMRTE